MGYKMNVILIVLMVSIISYILGWYQHDRMLQDYVRERVKRIIGIEFDRRDDVFQLVGMLSPLSDEDLRKVLLG